MNVIKALKSETQQIYNQLDSFTEEWIENYIASGGKVFCQKGCYNCCDLPVRVTLAEAFLISDNNDAVSDDRLRTYLDKLIIYVRDSKSESDYLKSRRTRIGMCPLLNEEGACSVHKKHPIPCRKTISVLHHQFCKAEAINNLPPLEVLKYLDNIKSMSDVTGGRGHYVDDISGLGSYLQNSLRDTTKKLLGFDMFGDLSLMVFLSTQEEFIKVLMSKNVRKVTRYLQENYFLHPYIISIEQGKSKGFR